MVQVISWTALAAGLVFGGGATEMSANQGAMALMQETPWRAMSQAPAPAVVLDCAEISETACTALDRALTAHLGAPPLRTVGDADAVIVTLEMTREESEVLEGRLIWRQGAAAPEAGPLMQTFVMDATVSPSTYDRFAKAVLRASAVPF